MSLVLDSNKPKKKAYDLDYNSLSQASIEETIGKDVDHISGILGVDASTASMLLRHLSWNKEKLIEKYMDNPSAVMVAAGAQLPEAPASTPPAQPIRSETSTKRSTRSLSKLLPGAKASSSSRRAHILSNISKPVKPADGPFTCPVCFDDSPGVTTSSLDCEHLYCTECWQQHLRSKIKDEGEHSISCMAERCTLLASDTFIRTVLKDEPATLKRYQELLVRNFVDTNPNLKFCPYPSCTNTVSCPGFSNKRILSKIIPTVSCGARGVPPSVDAEAREKQTDETGLGLGIADREHKFCFGCNIDTDHRPVVCSVTKMWMKKCADDSETANWIKGNTKECTKCQSTIEKNGGCNHMTCRKCRHEFCWICLGLWSEHTNSYNCNRYDEKSGTEARDAQSKSRASLERYLHYYNRWANHEQSAKLAADLFAKTERKMQEMQETSSLTWIEVQFMKKAFGEVDKCRGTLKWTYAMAYYLEKGNEKELFEDNQRDLERAVEELSELIEKPIDPETIATLKQQVTDKSVYVSKRNEIMLDDTLNGFLERRWKWNVTVDGFVGSVDDMDF
ncbi:RING-5 domain-containing protein [Flagelloscypha sp. PMI_526]|nr:RING-5 domain-containing protein [Flagelloscypha sp. PMI_526]